MSQDVMMWLGIAGIVILAFIIRFVVNTIFNKAGDAVNNKLAEKKNEKSGSREENLSDRHK
jgi:hypothetical protein